LDLEYLQEKEFYPLVPIPISVLSC